MIPALFARFLWPWGMPPPPDYFSPALPAVRSRMCQVCQVTWLGLENSACWCCGSAEHLADKSSPMNCSGHGALAEQYYDFDLETPVSVEVAA